MTYLPSPSQIEREKAAPGFVTSERKGFHVTFENGWTVSVQFGYGNYCDNYDWRGSDPEDISSRFKDAAPKSRTAEVAAWDSHGEWLTFDHGDQVDGRQTPEQVLALMTRVAALPAKAGAA